MPDTGLGRRQIGAIIAAFGALLCAVSAYLSWVGSEAPYELSIRHLVQANATGVADSYWSSVAAPIAGVALVAVLGALVRLRLLLGIAWMAGVTTLVLWFLMRTIGDATDDVAAASQTGIGVWACALGLLAILVATVVMGPRREEIDAPLSMFDDDDPRR